jgi:hypothetical protein
MPHRSAAFGKLAVRDMAHATGYRWDDRVAEDRGPSLKREWAAGDDPSTPETRIPLQPTTIIFNFADKTVTAVDAGPAGGQQLSQIAAQQHQMQMTSGRPKS